MSIPSALSCSRSPQRYTGLALLCGALLSGLPLALSAQSVSFAGPKPSVNFGSVNLCAAGQTTPAPCSETLTLSYRVTASGTLGTPKVLTLGAPNLDFTLASGSTCTGSVIAGNTCTVKVTFVPLFAGSRPGAVEITGTGGDLLATTLVYGLGSGPQIGFSGTAPIALPFTGITGGPHGIVRDGFGNYFLVDLLANAVLELPAAGGATRVLPFSGIQHPWDIAIDGAGDLFVADQYGNRVLKLPPGANHQIVLPFHGLNGATGVAVDGAGDLFATDNSNNRVVELPAGGGAQTTLPFSGLNNPLAMWVDSRDDVFVADNNNNRIVELPVGSSTQTVLPFNGLNSPQFVAVDAGGSVFAAQYNSGQVLELPGATAPQIPAVNGLTNPLGATVDSAGDLLVFANGDNVYGPGTALEVQRSQPPPQSFGTVRVGDVATLPLTIVNTGTGTLTFTPSIDNSNFKIAAPEPTTCLTGITAAQSCTLQIQFAPEASGVQIGSLTLATNGVSNPKIGLLGAAAAIDYDVDFSSGFSAGGATLQLNGSEAIVGNGLQLTNGETNNVGSAFTKTPVNIQTFSTDFAFQILDPNADGFTFTLQNAGPNAVGGPGGGLGYATIPKSAALKFDLYNNAGEGPNSTGVYIDGAHPSVPAINLAGFYLDLHSGDPFQVHLDYNGTDLAVTILDMVTRNVLENVWPIDIPATVGGSTAYVGFTSASGAETSMATITSWTYMAGRSAPTFPGGFSYSTPLTFSGNANVVRNSSIVGNALQLTNGQQNETGSIFSEIPVDIRAFTSVFTFQLSNPAADGFTFTIQNAGPSALGGGGGGLGYLGIAKSAAVKFDLYSNAGEGPNSTGLYTGGAFPGLPAVDLTGTAIDLHSGDVIQAYMTYDGVNLTMTLTDTVTLASSTHSWPIDIPATVGGTTAYVGFTGATGALSSTQLIDTWVFAPSNH